MMYKITFALGITVLLSLSLSSMAEDKLDYETHIKPILEEHCTKCHGNEKQKGSLRLDSPKEIVKGGGNGAVVTPRSPDHSPLYSLTALDEGDDDIMPPKGDPLTKKQIALIKKWIEQGAQFKDGTQWKSISKGKQRIRTVTKLDVLSKKVSKPSSVLIKTFKEQGVFVKYLSKNKHLIALDFSQLKKGIAFNKEHTVQIAELSSQLIALDLGEVDLGEVDKKFLSTLKNLQRLHLEKTNVTSKELKLLKKLEKLEYLNLYKTSVDDKGLEYLKELKNLKNLYLWQSKVSNEAAKKLGEALPKLNINMG